MRAVPWVLGKFCGGGRGRLDVPLFSGLSFELEVQVEVGVDAELGG